MSRLIEFENHKGEVLRGILDEAEGEQAIVFVHGFERTTIESKFKRIVDALRGEVTLFRFDFSGCGLSDGTFEDLTVEKLSQELACAVGELHKQCPHVQSISFVGFSLGCCVITNCLLRHSIKAKKLVFFAPGFNQKQLLRYFFTRQCNRDKNVTWENYQKYFDENAFQQNILLSKHLMKEHYLSNTYFIENAEKDYQSDFISLGIDPANVLILQGVVDDKVPPSSNAESYKAYNPLFVDGGDHDLQRPDMVEQYAPQLISFLTT
ncbi:MAG: alpha/beta hydrolase [Patescibacteria group bacterium]